MVHYSDDLRGVSADDLRGFFEGWLHPPTPGEHLEILEGSDHVVLALDSEGDRVIGFINAISDGTLASFIPLLEVRVEYRGRGIGTELVRRMLAKLEHMGMVDVVCDPDVVPFYERFGMHEGCAMMMRRPLGGQEGSATGRS